MRRWNMKDQKCIDITENIRVLEKNFHYLCNDFISYLDGLMTSGKLLHEEYERCSKVKKAFIEQKRQTPINK